MYYNCMFICCGYHTDSRHMMNIDYVLAILFIGYACILIYSFSYITGGML